MRKLLIAIIMIGLMVLLAGCEEDTTTVEAEVVETGKELYEGRIFGDKEWQSQRYVIVEYQCGVLKQQKKLSGTYIGIHEIGEEILVEIEVEECE